MFYTCPGLWVLNLHFLGVLSCGNHLVDKKFLWYGPVRQKKWRLRHVSTTIRRKNAVCFPWCWVACPASYIIFMPDSAEIKWAWQWRSHKYYRVRHLNASSPKFCAMFTCFRVSGGCCLCVVLSNPNPNPNPNSNPMPKPNPDPSPLPLP